jgi:aldehyde dehydrogenase (NAD+)
VVPVTLELGGKSPQICLADADLDAALPFLVNAGIQNAGQTCSAASRILVERAVFDEVVRAWRRATGPACRPGAGRPGRGPADLGAAARRWSRATWRWRAGRAAHCRRGADLRRRASAAGYYVRRRCWPVPAATGWRRKRSSARCRWSSPSTASRGLAIANGTAFGLVAGVWTRDGGAQLRLARKLKCGQVFVNNYGAGGGVELPFGGVGQSGHGREKGFEALYGFSTLKTVAD